MAGPAHVADLVSGLEARGIEHSVMVEDVERLTEKSTMPKGPRDMDWDSYHPIEDMYGYFDYLGWGSNLPQQCMSSIISYCTGLGLKGGLQVWQILLLILLAPGFACGIRITW